MNEREKRENEKRKKPIGFTAAGADMGPFKYVVFLPTRRPSAREWAAMKRAEADFRRIRREDVEDLARRREGKCRTGEK
jgi:hypothetical protein